MPVACPRLEDVEECLLATPTGHKHLRLVLRYGNQVLILPEAVVAAIVRAYVAIQTHPQRRAVALRLVKLDVRKDGYAEYQLLEVPVDETALESHVAALLAEAS
ncbi:MAG: hypothetical protein ONB23_00760 [candidate division KSB1 bacterium]|nr:hypothetical protein [candidate division KSB1 bacterium]